MGLYNDAIGSIIKYSLSTIVEAGSSDKKLQQFASECIREISLQKILTNGNVDD